MEKIDGALRAAGIATESGLSLAAHSSFRIGGRARLACFPKSRDELLTCLRLAGACGIVPTVIGNASNLVFPDGGLDGLTVFTGQCKEICVDGTSIRADAGATLASLAILARNEGLCGLEFAAGIPGTLGGAVLMNAGAYGGSMADICTASEFYDTKTDTVGRFSGEEQGFSNRTSVYEKDPRYVILGATLALSRGDRAAIEDRMRELAARRRASQPLDLPSAGSVFKRPDGHFAGKLIEDCGLKGLRISGAEVSTKHAGFIVNRGGATAADVRALVEEIRARVLAAYGVMLECEIRFL
jgi:UDP-N-acetylmuramate dehydrogenase